MKKKLMLLLLLFLLTSSPVFATIYTYSGSGQVVSLDNRWYDVQATFQVNDQLFGSTGAGWEPFELAPGQEIYPEWEENPWLNYPNIQYEIYDWRIVTKGTSYTGHSGWLRPWDDEWSLATDIHNYWWGWGKQSFALNDGTLSTQMTFEPLIYPGNSSGTGEIILARVPEPSTLMLLGIGLIVLSCLVTTRNRSARFN